MSDRGMAGCWFEARGQNQSADVDYQREILSTSTLSLWHTHRSVNRLPAPPLELYVFIWIDVKDNLNATTIQAKFPLRLYVVKTTRFHCLKVTRNYCGLKVRVLPKWIDIKGGGKKRKFREKINITYWGNDCVTQEISVKSGHMKFCGKRSHISGNF